MALLRLPGFRFSREPIVEVPQHRRARGLSLPKVSSMEFSEIPPRELAGLIGFVRRGAILAAQGACHHVEVVGPEENEDLKQRAIDKLVQHQIGTDAGDGGRVSFRGGIDAGVNNSHAAMPGFGQQVRNGAIRRFIGTPRKFSVASSSRPIVLGFEIGEQQSQGVVLELEGAPFVRGRFVNLRLARQALLGRVEKQLEQPDKLVRVEAIGREVCGRLVELPPESIRSLSLMESLASMPKRTGSNSVSRAAAPRRDSSCTMSCGVASAKVRGPDMRIDDGEGGPIRITVPQCLQAPFRPASSSATRTTVWQLGHSTAMAILRTMTKETLPGAQRGGRVLLS